MNDVFDPDFSGGGLQPLGFDQYTALYGRYHVAKFRYEVTFSNTSAAPVFVGLYASPQSTLPAVAIAWFVVNSTARTRCLGAVSGGNNTVVFRGTVNLPRVLGVTPQEYFADQDFGANTTSTPARVAYLHTWTVGRTAISSVIQSVRLYYDTEFSQQVALGMS
jgi:hypothetical protein